jgi:hypothetical protein
MGADGEFHAQDEAVDLSGTPGGLGGAGLLLAAGRTVFYQFFTRYVLNNSAAWTEEIARYLLIARGVHRRDHRRGQEQPHPGGLLLQVHAPAHVAGLSLAGGLAARGLFAAAAVS